MNVRGKMFPIDFISWSQLSVMKHVTCQVGFHVFITDNGSVNAAVGSFSSKNDATT